MPHHSGWAEVHACSALWLGLRFKKTLTPSSVSGLMIACFIVYGITEAEIVALSIVGERRAEREIERERERERVGEQEGEG